MHAFFGPHHHWLDGSGKRCQYLLGIILIYKFRSICYCSKGSENIEIIVSIFMAWKKAIANF